MNETKDRRENRAPGSRCRSRRSRTCVFAGFMMLMIFALCEAMLWVLSLTIPAAGDLLSPELKLIDPIIPDTALKHRPSPEHPEHDARGYRNADTLSRAAIVAIGDSQTYGDGVARNEAWPIQLADQLGASVYNISCGGWGPGQYAQLTDEACDLQPRLVIHAIYSGNDLLETYWLVYRHGQLPECRHVDPQVCAKLKQLDERHVAPADFQQAIAVRAGPQTRRKVTAEVRIGPRYILSQYSKTYGLLRAIKRQLFPEQDTRHFLSQRSIGDSDQAWAEIRQYTMAAAPENVFERDGLRTILTPTYRLQALDLDDARVAEGLRISLDLLRRVHRNVTAHGAQHFVLLIPTKELVFAPYVLEGAAPNEYAALRELIANEKQMWATVRESLTGEGIQYVDALPALQQSLANGDQPYPICMDGHPNALGHRVIAQSVAAGVQRLAEPVCEVEIP
jgi:lysophospholipase L1-like esterase